MYGLGEHYNSLRPSTHGAPHVLPPAPAATDPIGQRVVAV
jgi:OTU domain-containing protein 6